MAFFKLPVYHPGGRISVPFFGALLIPGLGSLVDMSFDLMDSLTLSKICCPKNLRLDPDHIAGVFFGVLKIATGLRGFSDS